MKKILGLVVSQRRLGNSELLLKEIMTHIPQPCSRELIRLTDLKIESCRACYRCLNHDTPCKIKDDFHFLLDKIKEADALLIGVPVYFLGAHASFKMLTDRMLGAGSYVRYTKNKPCIIVMPYGITGWEGYSKTAALAFPRFLEMKVVDCWMVHAPLPGASLLDAKNLQHAKELGSHLFEKTEYKKGMWECPQCGSDLFRLLPEGEIECSLCAAKGILQKDSSPYFPLSTPNRFFSAELQRHFAGVLPSLMQQYLLHREELKKVQKPYREKDWWIKP